MEDTSREVRAIQQQIWMSFSEEDRFRRCGEMFDLARKFALIRAPKGLSNEQLLRFVFKEMYGFEMPVRSK